MTAKTDDQKQVFATFRDTLRRLYHGRTPEAVRFQYAVIVVDLAITAFFIKLSVLTVARLFSGFSTLYRYDSARLCIQKHFALGYSANGMGRHVYFVDLVDAVGVC